jgi:multicomponent Na+:H+ antiporter subunit E
VRRVSRGFIVFILAFTVYVVYTGSISGYDIVTGVIVSAVIGALFSNIVVEKPIKVVDPRRWLHLLVYAVLYFTYYEAKAHIDVIRRILHPKLPVNPAIVEAPYRVESDFAITTVANSITNTPGTVVVDIDPSKRTFYIHWISAKTLDPLEARREIFETFEKHAKRIFE